MAQADRDDSDRRKRPGVEPEGRNRDLILAESDRDSASDASPEKMWSTQAHFRLAAKRRLLEALAAIGFCASFEFLIIGFGKRGDRMTVAIESGSPGTDASLARHLYAAQSRGSRGVPSDSLGQDLSFRLESFYAPSRIEFFVGPKVVKGSREIFLAVGFARASISQIPKLQVQEQLRELSTMQSLFCALIVEFMAAASREILLPDAGSSPQGLEVTNDDLADRAASRFIRSALFAMRSFSFEPHVSLFHAVSALPYEGRTARGSILVAHPEAANLAIFLTLQRPVIITNTRAVRKLLEATDQRTSLIVYNGEAYAFGHLIGEAKLHRKQALKISMNGRGSWTLSQGVNALMVARDGKARLPLESAELDRIRDLAVRILPDPDVRALLRLAKAAAGHSHGAMLIISADAEAEAKRLAPQAMGTLPAELKPKQLLQVMQMDGGILVDDKGVCHAVGVILDGRAAGNGDPSRGSRYNNAVRYLASTLVPAIVVVYSSDRTVDVLPPLRPRIQRRKVETAITQFLEAVVEEPRDFSRIFELHGEIHALSFYLSSEQCNQLNAALDQLDHWRIGASEDWLFEAHPEMDESYFYD